MPMAKKLFDEWRRTREKDYRKDAGYDEELCRRLTWLEWFSTNSTALHGSDQGGQ